MLFVCIFCLSLSVCLFATHVVNKDLYIVLFADMRKALSMDVEKKSMIPLSRDVRPEEVEWH